MNSSSRPSARIFELDSLRGLAALGVVVYHYGSHFHQFPLPGLLAPLYDEGWRAVDFFFALSGFVLARAYWTPARKDRLFPNIWDRVCRLYPLHLVTLALVALGQWYLTSQLHRGIYIYHLTDLYHFVLNLFLIHGLDASFNGPSWSISTEFVVNVLFFLAILLPRRMAFACFIGAIVASSLIPTEGTGTVLIPLARTLRGFCVGVLIYRLFTTLTGWRPPWLARAANVVFVVAAAGAIAYPYLPGRYAQFSGALTLLLSSALIISAPVSPVARSILNRAPLIYLGEISYSVYLVHFPLQLALWLLAVRFGLAWPLSQTSGLIAFLLATVGCAALTYRMIELPGKRWLRLPRKRSAAQAQVSVPTASPGSRTDVL